MGLTLKDGVRHLGFCRSEGDGYVGVESFERGFAGEIGEGGGGYCEKLGPESRGGSGQLGCGEREGGERMVS